MRADDGEGADDGSGADDRGWRHFRGRIDVRDRLDGEQELRLHDGLAIDFRERQRFHKRPARGAEGDHQFQLVARDNVSAEFRAAASERAKEMTAIRLNGRAASTEGK